MASRPWAAVARSASVVIWMPAGRLYLVRTHVEHSPVLQAENAAHPGTAGSRWPSPWPWWHRQGEEMRTEISAKFRRDEVLTELASTGLVVTNRSTDPAGDFAVCLAKPLR